MLKNHFTALLKQRLSQLQQDGLYRQRIVRHEPVASESILNFSSNDYLGFSNELAVSALFKEGFNRYPAGSGASAVIDGYHPVHQALENKIATLQGVEAALYFSSGYAANLALLMFLHSLDVTFIIDKAVHASIYDGLKLTRASYARYLHQDLSSLETILKQSKKPAIVLSEGIFSMSGQIAPLRDMLALCQHYDALCVLDEAHSFGILGQNGLGLAHDAHASYKQIPLRMLAFGKAVGAQGAAIVGEKIWIDALLQHARPYIYSTAPAPAIAYGLLHTLTLLFQANDRRDQLHARINYFRQSMPKLFWQRRESYTPIQSLYTGCPKKALALSDFLKQHAIICKPVRQPTVTRRETGLRIVLTAMHTEADIDRLVAVLGDYF